MKKFLSYIFIVVLLVGVGTPMFRAEAEDGCYGTNAEGKITKNINAQSKTICEALNGPNADAIWAWGSQPTTGGAAVPPSVSGTATVSTPNPENSEFVNRMEQKSCINFTNVDIGWCIVKGLYYIVYTPLAMLLWLASIFFNVLIAFTLSGKVFTDAVFINEAWALIRDLSNIFFIIVLFSIAIETILGLGHGGPKKMIAQVIVMALLINFSLFFSKVVIDASNILALVFYNKINVEATSKDGNPRPYGAIAGEKDVAGGMVSAFDPTTKLDAKFFELAREQRDVNGVVVQKATEVSAGTMIAIILIAGAVMAFAAYALFISALAFMGRLLELWVLIIFSPFAFMSSTLHQLAHMDYVGWDSWLKKLISASFMAPIFMFFLYFIFRMIEASMLSNVLTADQSLGGIFLNILLPAGLVLTLLMKAASFAKKGSGQLGSMAMTGLKGISGLALGAATGGGAMLLRGTVGRAGSAVANSAWAARMERRGFGGGMFKKAGNALGTGSFDVRGIKVAGKNLSGITGIPLGSAQKGGFEQLKKEQIAAQQKKAKNTEVADWEPEKVQLKEAELQLRDVLEASAHEMHEFDEKIKDARQNLQDAQNGGADQDTLKALKKLLDEQRGKKSARKAELGITDLQHDIAERKQKITDINQQRRRDYAEGIQTQGANLGGFITRGISYSPAAAKDAAYKIRMGAKIVDSGIKKDKDDSHGGDHGGGHDDHGEGGHNDHGAAAGGHDDHGEGHGKETHH